MRHQDPRNDFLQAVPEDIRKQWHAQGRTVHLDAGQVIGEPSAKHARLYFPLTAVMSWVSWLQDGSMGALAIIGREGMVGLEPLPGLSQHLWVVCHGEALEVPLSLVQGHAQSHPSVLQLLLQNHHRLMAQASQTAISNQHHGMAQRLRRLLRAIFERVEGSTLHMTQGQLADLLGTRRERVSRAAAELQQLGLIRCARGRVTLTDRPGLLGSGA